MKKPIPINALCKEAEKILGGLCNDSWVGQNGWMEHFSFWIGGDTVKIRIQNGRGLTNNTSYCHYVELSPRKRKAVFYEHCGLPEKRKIIEENLIARGYTIYQRDSRWFNLSRIERSLTEHCAA